MSEHTPGPWEASNTSGPWSSGGDEGTVEAISPDGAFVTREICHFFIDPDDEGTLGEDLANARLIAAAPIGWELAEMVINGRPYLELAMKAQEFMAKAGGAD